jgi:hypothetical protein
MSGQIDSATTEAEPCEYCGDGDRVPRGHWICPVCDAEWPEEDETQ